MYDASLSHTKNMKKGIKINHLKRIQVKSIQGKIRLAIIATAVMVSILIASIVIPTTYMSLRNSNHQNLQEFAKIASQRINMEMDAYKKVAFIVAQNPIISNTGLSYEERYKELKQMAQISGFMNYGITNVRGVDPLTGEDVSQTEYFEYVSTHKVAYISRPIVVEEAQGKKSVMIVAAPIMHNNQFDGMLYLEVNGKVLSDAVSCIKFGETGNASIMDNRGVTIAHSDYNLVLEQFSSIEAAKIDKSLRQLAAIEKRQIEEDEETGASLDTYRFNMKNRIISYVPVEGTTWELGIAIDQAEFMKPVINSIVYIIIVLLIALALSNFLAYKIAKGIATPIKKSIDRIKLLAEGDLSSPVEEIQTSDETGVLVASTKELVDNFSGFIQDIIYILSEIAEGNLDVKSQKEYYGDFKPINEAMNKIINGLNTIMAQINQSAQEVSSGSEEIAKGATELAQGASEQASIIEEFMASTEEISSHITTSIEQVNKTSEIAQAAKDKAGEGKEGMGKMLEAMDDISQSSRTISEVIKSIENIASQTNLLALNAAIEAARVGEAGKGFAVVASEIRDLANRSAETVKEIEEIIGTSLVKVEDGQEMAKAASEALEEIVGSVEQTAYTTGILLESSEQQKIFTTELVKGTKQLSEIVEVNASTSQESAAISEELAAQAENLKSLIEYFKLRV